VTPRAQSARGLIFRVSLLASIVAIALIPFYEHWVSKLGYAALASDSLHLWLDSGLAAGAIAFVGSLFGKGVGRIVAFFISVLEIYYWFVLSIAM
jgi:divalent metal cation (Fe/Co/Zn/Cd) transporter